MPELLPVDMFVGMSVKQDVSDLQSEFCHGWALYDAKSKNQKKGQFTIPSIFRKKSIIKEGSEVLIETLDNEPIIHPLVSNPIKEGYGLFGKETLDSRELKMFAQTSHVISKV